MGGVISFGAPPFPPKSDYAVFCDARRAMFDALSVWLATKPSANDAEMEIVGTINILNFTSSSAKAANGS